MENLEFELKLENKKEDKVTDGSGNKNKMIVTGANIVGDGTFGSALYFKGDNQYVDIPYNAKLNPKKFTISCWVKVNQIDRKMIVIDNADIKDIDPAIRTTRATHSFYIGYQIFASAEGKWLFEFGLGNKAGRCSGPETEINKWTHLAVTYDGMKTIFYVDGENIASSKLNASSNSSKKMRIGASNQYSQIENLLDGQIANLRIYSRAFTREEIETQIDTDLAALNVYRSTLPIDFNLFNKKDDKKALYITDDYSPNSMNLEIRNTTSKIIQTRALKGAPNENNFHFALYFRPGVLISEGDGLFGLTDKHVTEGWGISSQKMPDNSFAIYLLQEKAIEIKTTKSLKLHLNGFVADNLYGSRGTQVELKYHHLNYAQKTDSNLAVGIQTAYLNIVSHLGKEYIPLHVGFIGSNTVLNDRATENELTLRITNISKEHVIRWQNDGLNKQSMLTFSFTSPATTFKSKLTDAEGIRIGRIVYDDRGRVVWSDQAETIPKTDSLSLEGGMSESDSWSMDLFGLEPLSPGNFIDIYISELVCDKPTGMAYLYIKYEDIVGFWDGQFVIPIEKSPLIFRDEYGQQRVGIGTDEPESKLDVRGTIRASILDAGNGRIEGGSLHVGAGQINCGNIIGNKLDVKGGPIKGGAITGSKLDVKGGPIKGGAITGSKLDVGSSGTIKGGAITGSKLDVGSSGTIKGGSLDVKGGTINGGPITGSSGTFSGNVGIGTPDPPTKGKLEIIGGLGMTSAFSGKSFGTTGIKTYSDYKTGVSLYCSMDIVAGQILMASDLRIKHKLGCSKTIDDLNLLLKLTITDFTYIDVFQKGNIPQKKLIAQQVKKVFPQAVTLSIDEVPDIYQASTILNGWVTLGSNLKVGEKVKLIFENEEKIFEVLETRQSGFRVDTDKTGEVFVYGRQVDDFHNVDYDAISMLNVSATQEIARQMEQLQVENKAQATRIKELEKLMEDMETLKATVAQLQLNLSADRQELNGEMMVGSN